REVAARCLLRHAPALLGAIGHRPNPQQRPKRAEGEETDPGRGTDRILVRMVARLRNLVGNAPHCNQAVDNQRDDRDQDSKGNVVKDHRLCYRSMVSSFPIATCLIFTGTGVDEISATCAYSSPFGRATAVMRLSNLNWANLVASAGKRAIDLRPATIESVDPVSCGPKGRFRL